MTRSSVKIGGGEFVYEVLENWEQLPDGFGWPETAGVATDNQDNVYVFNRGEHPMMVFDQNGSFIKSWGEGIFTRPHGVSLGPDNTLYCSDDGDHTIRQCTIEGKVLLTIGNPGNPAKAFSGIPFNRCTHTAIDPTNGDIFISDGYQNSRIHKYSPNGELLLSWGEPGTDIGQFNIAHNIATDKDGYVYVCDRENHRIQIFDRKGNFETLWATVHRPCGIYIDPKDDKFVYIAELGWGNNVSRNMPNIGPRLTVLNKNGEIIQRIGDKGYGLETGQFIAPHGICLDSKMDIYVAEVARTNMSHYTTPPESVRSFQKLLKV